MVHVLVTHANASSTNVSGICHYSQHVPRNWNQKNIFDVAICTTDSCEVLGIICGRGWG